MAGDEEARASAVLAEMQLRIAEGPTSALGIGEVVTPEEVRSAFLALTKQFHPARFGRLSTDLQKLSNEVFLGIKAAHDHMLKVLGSSTAASRGGSGSSTRSTGAIPISQLDGNKTARGTQSIPRVDGSAPAASHLARGTDRDGRASSPVIGSQRTGTPPMGVSVARTATPVGGAQRPTGAIPVHRGETPTGSQGQRPTGSIPVARDSGPATGVPQRSTGSIPIQRPGTPPPTGRAITPVPPGTVPGVGPSATPEATRQPTPGAGTPPLPSSRAVTPVPPGTQPGVGGSQRMVRIRTSTGAMINVPAGQAGTRSGGTSPPLSRTMTPRGPSAPPHPDASIDPATQPPRAGTLKPGHSSPLAPPTQPPKPITLRPGQSSPIAQPMQPARHGTLQPGQSSPLAPARHGTLQPGQSSPLAPTQPPKPITLPPGQTSPLTPPTQPPRGHDSFNPPTVRGIATQSSQFQHPDTFDEGAAFREAAALMEAKNWTGARQALSALAAKVPQSKTFRAWLCYARGREAYIAGRPDDAILEMQRALQLEPDLAHAKHALAELQRRR